MIRFKVIVPFILAFLMYTVGLCQNPDSIFTVLKGKAYTKDYTSAQSGLEELVQKFPERKDYKIFLGRLLAWQKKYESSKEILRNVITAENKNTEAYEALIDVEIWEKDYNAAINDCKVVLSFCSESERETFLLKYARALYLSGDMIQAREVLNTLLHAFPGNNEGKRLKGEIFNSAYKNYLSVSYLNISFSGVSFPSWNYITLEYQRKLKNCPLIGRFNYGNAYKTDGYQLELEAYPKLSKGSYMYLNGGIANLSPVFSRYRAGAEIYQKLPYGFEASGGIRYLFFSTRDVFIYTAYLGCYYSRFWVAYRPFLVNRNNDMFFSHTGIIRFYLAGTDKYLSLNLIYGAAPYTTNTIQDVEKVNSKRIGVDAQWHLASDLLLKPMFSYEYEEFSPEVFRNRFYGQLTLLKRF